MDNGPRRHKRQTDGWNIISKIMVCENEKKINGWPPKLKKSIFGVIFWSIWNQTRNQNKTEEKAKHTILIRHM